MYIFELEQDFTLHNLVVFSVMTALQNLFSSPFLFSRVLFQKCQPMNLRTSIFKKHSILNNE